MSQYGAPHLSLVQRHLDTTPNLLVPDHTNIILVFRRGAHRIC